MITFRWRVQNRISPNDHLDTFFVADSADAMLLNAFDGLGILRFRHHKGCPLTLSVYVGGEYGGYHDLVIFVGPLTLPGVAEMLDERAGHLWAKAVELTGGGK